MIATSPRQQLRAWFLALCLLCVSTNAAPSGLVYRLTHDRLAGGYLVGTMHSEDPRVLALLDDLAPLIAQVDAVSLEVVPDGVALLAASAATLLPRGQSLQRIVGERRYADVLAAAADEQIPPAVLDRLKPWAVAVTLGMPRSQTGEFMDMQIYLAALAAGKEAVGLETIGEQIAVFEQLTPDDELTLLDAMVKNRQAMPKQLEDLTLAYLTGDLESLEGISHAQFGELAPSVSHWFEEKMLRERNQRMLERSTKIMMQKSMLIAVGALHLVGESGLIAGFERMGFRVEPLTL